MRWSAEGVSFSWRLEAGLAQQYVNEVGQTFAPRLVNGPFEDPALFVRFRHERRALLFDLGSLGRLSVRDILKVSDVFVSHTHIDHFIGFDHLLRFSLNRERILRLFGPRGFIDNVRAKLAAYTWNLLRDSQLVLAVHETDGVTTRRVELKAAHNFRQEEERFSPFSGTLLEEPGFRIQGAILDHKIPCLAFNLEEPNRFNIKPDVLEAMGLKSGSWLDELKKMLREKCPRETRLQAPLIAGGNQQLALQQWCDLLIVETKGQKIAYVVDNQYNRTNASRIISLAKNADLFYCEASFSQSEQALARERYHLTAKQAGVLARRAQVGQLIPFHFSTRYQSEPDRLKREALSAFTGGDNGEAETN